MKRSAESDNRPTKFKKFSFKSMAYFEDHPSEDYEQTGEGAMYKEISHSQKHNAKFALTEYKTKFVLNGALEEPTEGIEKAFQKIIDDAISKSEKTTVLIGITVDGEVLTDPIYLPFRPPEQNTVQVLMAELDKLGQSEDEDGMDKRTLLLSLPITIVVTCCAPPTGGAPKFFPYQHFGYNNEHLIRINNNDNYCLFHALVAARAFVDLSEKDANSKKKHKSDKNKNRMRTLDRLINDEMKMCKMVKRLMKDAGIRTDLPSYGMEHLQPVQDLWDRTVPGKYRIVFFEDNPEQLPKPTWKGKSGGKAVTVFLSNKHYDAITKIPLFFGLGRKYCIDCECSYTRDSKHTIECKSRCYQCGKVGPEFPCVKEDNVKIHCQSCNRYFFSKKCFELHKPATCNLWKRCRLTCKRVYAHDPKHPHKCYTTYCVRCKVNHEKGTGCYIQKIKVPEEKQRYRIVVWDSETRLEQKDGGYSEHIVNYISARITCTDCCDSEEGEIEDCEICANDDGIVERMKDWSEANGENPVSEFAEWILRAWDNEFDTYIWAHNSSRFDGHFILRYLAASRRRPEIIMNGLKIYNFKIRHSKANSMLTWRDSCLLLPVKLEDLKPTFGLSCDDKPFFPYNYNKRENYGIRLPYLPPKDDYCPNSMKKDKFVKFEQWYEENKSTPFFLPEELCSYCRNDTEILLQSIVAFRRILMEEVTNGFDVLPISCTIASVCMNIFRANFLRENELAMIPEGGYEKKDRASAFAIKYMDWLEHSEKIKIQHAGNGREKQYKGYKLDGWIESKKKAIEFHGCYWHGCERCFNPDARMFDRKTCRELFEKTEDRIRQIKEPDDDGNCIHVEEIWECEVLQQIRKNPEMKKFFGDLANDRGPIDPRHAYCGGRTGPLKLFAEMCEKFKISVFDIISLYPWVNFDTLYPIGLPNIIRPSHDEMNVHWTDPADLQYKGIYKVRVIPPRGLRIPVLPVKQDERLLFGCCHRCASDFRKKLTRCNHSCPHYSKDRAYTGSYTHIELERALQNGYVVDRFWRAWHYERWSNTVFKDYVRLFLKLKVEASGLPSAVQTEEQKHEFTEEYKKVYGVDLNMQRIQKNPGLRFIAKLCLNSLWGKFSMRNSLGTNKVVTNAPEFFNIVFNHRVEISSIVQLSDEVLRVQYKPKSYFATEHASSNIVISLWTTSRARLKLLDYMEQAQKAGADVYYTDTDSLIVRHLRDQIPIKTGEYLGQMSEEYADHEITTFVCGGAKQYALRMINKKTGKIEYVQKIRGITFDVENSKALQFEKFKEKVLHFGKEDQYAAVFKYAKINPTKASNIITREQRKKYLPVCQKGIINDELDVLPFGYE